MAVITGPLRPKESKMKFQPVSEQSAGNGNLTIIRGSNLITIVNGAQTKSDLAAGTVVTGVFSGTSPNKYDPARSDYSLRSDDGTLIILAETASLKQQLSKVVEGDLVQITYKGKREIVRKNGAKAEMHDYMVARAVDAE